MINTELKIVVGSWKAYTECNERAMGSSWLTLDEFQTDKEIKDELKKQGFTDLELEELFIQDYEGSIRLSDCDSINPIRLFNLLRNNNYFDDDDEAQNIVINSYENVITQFIKNLENKCIPSYFIYKGDKIDYEIMMVQDCCYNIPDWLENYIDYKRMADDDLDVTEIEIDGETYTIRE